VSTICHTDIESFSESKLPKIGVYRYAEHPSTEVMCLMYKMDDGLVNMWLPYDPSFELSDAIYERFGEDPRVGEIYFGRECPPDIFLHAISGGQFRAHNAEFERVMLNGHPGQDIGFPKTKIKQWVCTAAKGAAHGLPRKLEKITAALGTPHQKDMTNHSIMMQLCRPRKKEDAPRWTPEADTSKYLAMYSYCIDDVECERDVDQAVPDLPPREQVLYMLDQKINQRGVYVDLPSVESAMIVRDQYKELLSDKCKEITGLSPNQTMKLKVWVAERYEIADLQAPTIDDAIVDPSIPAEVKRVLRIRRSHEMKAASKLDAIIRSVCADRRLHGMLMYYGASTGRWSSLLVQLQNLFRGVISDPNTAIDILTQEDLDWLRFMYDELDPMQVIASCIRGLITASPGKVLVCADYVAIEGRVTAWLAGQEDKLEVYRTHGKVYEHTAARLFGLSTDVEDLLLQKRTHPDQRFMGKTCELALGFQGGWRALVKAARKGGQVLEQDLATSTVYNWRDVNSNIKQLWYNLEDCFKAAINEPGSHPSMNKLIFHVKGDWLYMQLPSKRNLAYYKPEINRHGNPCYMGVDTYTRQWRRVETFGGRLVENAAQATARDILAHSMPNIERAGYPIILTVHDELIAEVPEGFGSVEEVEQIMADVPEWTDGLPVKAEGFSAVRYEKDM